MLTAYNKPFPPSKIIPPGGAKSPFTSKHILAFAYVEIMKSDY